MSNVRTINGIPIMTYGLTGMLIGILTYSTFAPEPEPEPETTSIFSSIPDIKNNSISNTIAQLSVPSFMPAATVVAAPIPAFLAPSAELSKSVSDMLTPSAPSLEVGSGTEETKQTSISGSEEPKSNPGPIAEEPKDPNQIEDSKSTPGTDEEEELGLRGGKKNKTRKYKR